MNEPLRLPPETPTGHVLIETGGDIDSSSACLRVYGDQLDPDAISVLLGAKPTSACRKGDIARGKIYDRIEKQGRWLFALDHQTEVTLEVLINRLLDQMTGDLTTWRQVTAQFRVDLFCGLQLEQWNRGLNISPQTLQRIAERGLPLDLDIYYVGERDTP